MSNVHITHSSSDAILAEGPVGWMCWLPNPPFAVHNISRALFIAISFKVRRCGFPFIPVLRHLVSQIE